MAKRKRGGKRKKEVGREEGKNEISIFSKGVFL
jgi:hypothetical protein